MMLLHGEAHVPIYDIGEAPEPHFLSRPHRINLISSAQTIAVQALLRPRPESPKVDVVLLTRSIAYIKVFHGQHPPSL